MPYTYKVQASTELPTRYCSVIISYCIKTRDRDLKGHSIRHKPLNHYLREFTIPRVTEDSEFRVAPGPPSWCVWHFLITRGANCLGNNGVKGYASDKHILARM